MKSSVLQPDDFQVEMFVTVKDVIRNTNDFDEEDLRDPLMMMRVMRGQQSEDSKSHLEMLKGSVIRIDAINLPFIMTTIFENITQIGKAPRTHSASLDVRELEFIKLNEEYVSAYLGTSPLTALLQGKDFNDIQNIIGYDTLADVLNKVSNQLQQEEDRREKE